MDESSLKSRRSGLYINRKKKTCPKAAALHPRDVKTLHILGGISMKGTIVLNVRIILNFCHFK